MQWIAVAIGAFYVFAGVVVLRRMAMDSLLDVVLQAITLEKTSAKERLRSRVLTLGGCLTFASGLALMTLSPWATVFFAANAIVQGGYLLWARKALPSESVEEQQGRNQTQNAYVIYLAAFAFVVHAQAQGVLSYWPWPVDLGRFSWLVEPLVISAVTAALWANWFVRMPRSAKSGAWSSSEGAGEVGPADEFFKLLPDRLRLAPEYGCWPTWDDETGDNVDPAALGFSDALLARLRQWDDVWQETFKPDDPGGSGFGDGDAGQRWQQEGQEIAAQLAEEWSGELVVKL